MATTPPSDPHFLRRTPSALDQAGEHAAALRARLEEGKALRAAAKPFLLMEQRSQWDLAIVLDACRYDTFARVNWLAGRLERRFSPGSCTEEWLAANFDGRFEDVIYISASPYLSRVYLHQAGLGQPFALLEEVWKDGWDDSLHTVRPEAVIDAYLRLRQTWPGRKYILHFMQPHHPFIGQAQIRDGWRKYWGALETDLAELDGKLVYELLEEGKLDRAAVVAAYEDNLRHVLERLEQLLRGPVGRAVITSDHGDCFGECGVFGHPPGLTLPELIEVPYFLPSAALQR